MARQYQGRIQFGIVNTNVFPDLADTMYVAEWVDDLAFAVHDLASNRKYPMSHDGNTSGRLIPERASRFVQDFFDGRLKPTIKSALVPSVQTGPVIEVVGLTYDEIVLDQDKDLLVEFYTPSCQPCKALLPMYERLASLYASDERATGCVTIAKIDYEANDVPDKDIRGFPWFKLYPAERKGAPVTYQGERTVEGWAGFIAKNGTNGVRLDLEGTM